MPSLRRVSPRQSKFTVTRTDDPVLNHCPVGDCSLRGAIDAAHNAPGHDTIILAPGTYNLQIPRESLPGEPEGFSGDLDFVTNLTIRNPQACHPEAPAPSEAMIDANGETVD